MFKKVDPRQNFPEMERDMLEFWKENKVFEESMHAGGRPTFSFYDGPPFATGLPHYGHVVASLIKDVVPRYWTMKGNHVERRWGWDCHGLPVENLIEKEMGLKNKQAIEKIGIDKFNEACCGAVLRYANDWKEFIPRIGRWVDMENDYKTMNWQYTESIWWVFSEIYKKGLVYEGYKSMHMCPRCETTLANFEVTQGYKDITDLSATVKFKLKSGQKIGDFVVDDRTYILAWTTTPWTLPGNVALAVGKDVEYVLVKFFRTKQGELLYKPNSNISRSDCDEEIVILSKDLLSKTWTFRKLGSNTVEELASVISDGKAIEYDRDIIREIKGSDLVGLSYEPLFDYYAKKEDLEHRGNGWKIYAGDFVTTEEGTGIVHIAPAFGEDDMLLAHQYKLPFVQHVSRSGRFLEFINSLSEEDKIYFIDKDGQGREVKPKRNPRETDEKVVEYMEKENKLFAKENYKHSYPHCWRCDTPLLNYASGSWFVEVTKIKDNLIKNNQGVNWVPGYIKDGRFGKWLEDVRDWAVSRSRFWGAPLPIWKCGDCSEIEVIGSIDELREKTDQKITKFIFARHGLAENNVLGVLSSRDDEYHLTKEGRKQAEDLAEKIKDEKIDVIISSPILRALETAEIVAGVLDMHIEKNELARELNHGSWDGFTIAQLQKNSEIYRESSKLSRNGEEIYNFHSGGDGESRADTEKRVREFIKECVVKYPGKNILVISHGIMGAMLDKILNNLDIKGFFMSEAKIENAKAMIFYAGSDGKGFDLHKPYIDDIKIKCPKCGKPMKIVGDVFDCWFESGSMPYAQIHYPFENKDKFQKSFPADFIAEGIDQTRGWFYTLMVLSTALFDKPAFKNVIVNGIVLAEDGQKMSKKLKNYPDPNLLLEKYGADSLRYYLLTSPVMKAENLRFSEKGVDEVLKRFVLTLWNTYSFLVMNVELSKIEKGEIIKIGKSENPLDQWILSELNLLITEVDEEMQDYDLIKASRPLGDFVDKLSNWYLRRSRRRFISEDAKDKLAAYQTLYYVLITFTKLMAPFMPFLADEIFKNLSEGKSVHLEDFPKVSIEGIDDELSGQMNLVRDVVTLGLAVRAQNRIKVRMPLQNIEIRKEGLERLNENLAYILKEELNIKSISIVKDIREREGLGIAEDKGIKVALDLRISEELELEGLARETIRQIQAMRKIAGYNRDDLVQVKYEVSEPADKFYKMFVMWSEDIKSECLLSNISPAKEVVKEDFDGIDEMAFDGEKIILVIKK